MSERKAHNKNTVVVMVVNDDGSKTIKRVACSGSKKSDSRLRKSRSSALSRAVFG
ncbi:hypothetical protein MSP8887_01063 [Marinomonas spartinae]|nr:hypothetical protein MSP8887_01063 [Marinomonas spartinae]